MAIDAAKIISEKYPEVDFVMLFVGSEQNRGKYLRDLKKKYPISFLEILPNAVEKPKLPIDQIEECEKENELNYYGGM